MALVTAHVICRNEDTIVGSFQSVVGCLFRAGQERPELVPTLAQEGCMHELYR